MAIWFKDTYANVFAPEAQEKFVKANISTARKSKSKDNPDDAVYINSSWRASFVGKCVEEAKKLQHKDKINIKQGYISHEKAGVGEDGKGIYYTNVTILDFEKRDGGSNQASATPSQGNSEDDGLPF